MSKIVFCITLLLLFLSLHAKTQDVENLINNPDFEGHVFAPWRIIFKPDAGGEGQILIDDKESFTGRASMMIEIKDGGNHERGVHVIQQPLMAPVKKDRKYTYCAWIKAEEERTLFMRLMKSGGGDVTVPVRQNFTVNEEWAEYFFTADCSEDTDLRVEFELGLFDVDIWIDNVRFYEGEYVDEGLGKSQIAVPEAKFVTTCWSMLKSGI